MRQLRILQPKQVMCLECRQPYIPFSVDLIRSWADDVDFPVDEKANNIATAETFQDGLQFCEPTCADTYRSRQMDQAVERLLSKMLKKKR